MAKHSRPRLFPTWLFLLATIALAVLSGFAVYRLGVGIWGESNIDIIFAAILMAVGVVGLPLCTVISLAGNKNLEMMEELGAFDDE